MIDCSYSDKNVASCLDIVKIRFVGMDNHAYQSENHIIDAGYYWSKVGEVKKNELAAMVDNPPSLWHVGYSTNSGQNDRVPLALLTGPSPTLYLIRPENVGFRVLAEGANFGNPRKKVRAFFDYRGTRYGLSVTDLEVEAYYSAMDDGFYPANVVSYFTVSMTEQHYDFAYKVIAAVF